MCRKHHGSLFATVLSVPPNQVRWIAGEEKVGTYASSAECVRTFCTECGSVAPVELPQIGTVAVPVGNLTGELDLKPSLHIFVGSKAPWYTITDNLPRFEAYPPGVPIPAVERPAVTPKPGLTLGSCLCGEVAFEIEGAPLRAYNCHCSRCRRGRSAAHATNVFYPMESFRWTRGAENVAAYKVPEARRFAVAFCRRCGGAVPRLSTELRGAIVPAGSLDTDPGMQPLANIFVGSKATWFDITDGLPQHTELPS